MSTASIREPASSQSSPTISTSRTASPSRPTRDPLRRRHRRLPPRDGPHHIRAFDGRRQGQRCHGGQVFATIDTGPVRRLPPRHRRQCLDQRRRRRSLLRARRRSRSARVKVPEVVVQRRLRRAEAEPAVHHRYDVALQCLCRRRRSETVLIPEKLPVTWDVEADGRSGRGRYVRLAF